MIFFFSFFGVEHYKVDDNISIKFEAMNYRFKQCKDKLAIKIIQINENNSAFSLKKKAIKTNQFGNQEPECNDSVGNSNDEALE